MIVTKNHPIIDANINRFKEGTRVLEDVVRFILLDEGLFLECKALKHSLRINPCVRRTNEDIGGIDFKETQSRSSLLDLVNANALRMQEALRVLEEFGDRTVYKPLRFSAYELHSKILVKLKKQLKLDQLQGVYAICDPSHHSIPWMASIMNQASISVCQIRMKKANKKTIYAATAETRALLDPQKTCLIVNDHLDIALACADGVHLGQDDFPIESIREIVPSDFIVGVTCHSLEEAKIAVNSGVNYISLGCLYPTKTKQDTISIPLETVQKIIDVIDIPVCIIGGIQLEHLSHLNNINPSMIAIHSALWDSVDPLKTEEKLREYLP